MNERIMQEKTVSAILQEPVKVWVTVEHQNLLHKLGILSRQRPFWIRPATLSTLARISVQILKLTDLRNVSNEQYAAKIIEEAGKNIDALANILCLAIHNSREYPEKKLKDFLIKNLTVTEMLQLIVIVVSQIDVQSFSNTITLIKGVSLLKAGEIIASGEPSEAFKNISESA